MSERFSLPHLEISHLKQDGDYQAPSENRGGGSAPRIREEHGARLKRELEAAFTAMDQRAPATPEGIEPAGGKYVEVEILRQRKVDKLERKKDGVKPGAVRMEQNEALTVALFVPNEAKPVLERILEDYTGGDLTEAGNPPNKGFVEPIEAIREARLQTFWTDDPDAIPESPETEIWWEVWCFSGMEESLSTQAQQLGANVGETHYWLRFPEAAVVPIFTNRVTIELLLFTTFGISELRRASASPVFFTDENRAEQYEWAVNLAERITWPGNEAPAICLLDTGVNRAHVLIEPALSTDDLMAINSQWGEDDHASHGTLMAGLALHGDLTPRLIDESETELKHRLESVKLLPPHGLDANDPRSYGAITQSGISIAEINNPERDRVFCMAVTNENVSGSRATTWSAAIDQIASGAFRDEGEEPTRRLFVISAGNIPEHIERDRILPNDEYPIEDPAQAWNAITVGGYTNKTETDEEDLQDHEPFVDAGALSPHSRTSVLWPQSKTAFKPDVVMEAGNRVLSPDGGSVYTPDSLCTLTTGSDVDRQPLSPFCATSAATAQVSRIAAMLTEEFPNYWPETIRALIIHSAGWTQSMEDELAAAGGLRERYPALRRFGYGVPSPDRARASAINDLALVAQNYIQPFKSRGGRRFSDCHYYRLPWPLRTLEDLGETEVELKVTLSYFIEPNPGVSSSVDPQRYQSFGLRFDLMRPLEDSDEFLKRLNAKERDDPQSRVRVASEDNRWMFGSQSVSAGSVHCDVWRGPATQLALRNMLCVKPTVGWWRNRASIAICNQKARYALVITLRTEDIELDLYTPVTTTIEAGIDVEIET